MLELDLQRLWYRSLIYGVSSEFEMKVSPFPFEMMGGCGNVGSMLK